MADLADTIKPLLAGIKELKHIGKLKTQEMNSISKRIISNFLEILYFFILLANPLHILIHSFLNSNFELGSQDGDENQTNGTPPIDTESAHVK